MLKSEGTEKELKTYQGTKQDQTLGISKHTDALRHKVPVGEKKKTQDGIEEGVKSRTSSQEVSRDSSFPRAGCSDA